jgi:hypothetical protein
LEIAREDLLVEEVSVPMNAFAEALDTLLASVSETVAEDDRLYAALHTLAGDLHALEGQLESYTRDWAQTQLDEIFADSVSTVNAAIFVQYTNQSVKDMSVTRLMEIFNISEDELPEEEKTQLPDSGDKEEDNEKNEEEKGDQGGLGEGNVLYGSDDVIFDPVKNEHVKYGDVINEYFAAVSEKIINGQIPDTLEQFISDYFKTLYDGSEKENAD